MRPSPKLSREPKKNEELSGFGGVKDLIKKKQTQDALKLVYDQIELRLREHEADLEWEQEVEKRRLDAAAKVRKAKRQKAKQQEEEERARTEEASETRKAEEPKKSKTSNWLSSPWALAAYLGLAAAAVLNVDYLTSLFYTTPVQSSPAAAGAHKVIKWGIPAAITALLGYKTYRRYKGAKSTEQGSPTDPNEEGLTPEEVEERNAESSGEKRVFGLKRNHIIIGGIILVCIALFALLFMCDDEENPEESKDDNGGDLPQGADGWDAEPEDLL